MRYLSFLLLWIIIQVLSYLLNSIQWVLKSFVNNIGFCICFLNWWFLFYWALLALSCYCHILYLFYFSDKSLILSQQIFISFRPLLLIIVIFQWLIRTLFIWVKVFWRFIYSLLERFNWFVFDLLVNQFSLLFSNFIASCFTCEFILSLFWFIILFLELGKGVFFLYSLYICTPYFFRDTSHFLFLRCYLFILSITF